MRPRPPAVGQDVGVGAACFLQGISQDGHSVEGTFVVDGFGQLDYRAIVPGQPRRVHAVRPEAVEDATDESAFKPSLYGEPIRVFPSNFSLRCLPYQGRVSKILARPHPMETGDKVVLAVLFRN